MRRGGRLPTAERYEIPDDERMSAMAEDLKPQILTERQIAWCRKNIKSFSDAWRAVQNADEHRLKVYEKLGIDPGGLPRHAA